MTPRRALLLAGLALLGVGIGVYTAHPSPAGRLLLDAVLLALAAVIVLGPVLADARPRSLWTLVTAGCVLALVETMLRIHPTRLGPVAAHDVVNGLGRVLVLVWVLALTLRVVGHRVLLWSVLDTATLTLGLTLAKWTFAQHLPTLLPVDDLTWAIHSLADLAVIGLGGQLLYRLGRSVPALGWFVLAAAVELVLDSVATAADITGTTPPPYVAASYVFVAFAAAAGLTHPGVLDLTRNPPPPIEVDSTPLRTLYLTASLVPAVIALLTPAASSSADAVRAVLVAAFLVLLATRLLTATTALARSEARSVHRATHDGLTGLLNRAALFDALEARLRTNGAAGRSTALIYLDCDDFKHVNATWGQQAGDAVLRLVADGLTRRVGDTGLVARHGGDDFVVVVDVADVEGALAVAESVKEVFAEPVPVLPRRLHTLTPSIGIAVAEPGSHLAAMDLLGEADIALRAAKDAGRGGCVVYDAELRRRSVKRAVLADALREAITTEQLSVAFQPIRSGPAYTTLSGWEALARWNDPQVGQVSPADFIPLAEELGLICQLGDVVLRRSLGEFATLVELLDLPDATLAVNVSAPQLLQTNYVESVADVLRETGVPARSLVLEITESLLVDDRTIALDTLHGLRALGVGLNLDDFGTGYASVATLLRLPIDGVKIDRSIVERLEDDEDGSGAAQVQAIIDLAASLGIRRVVAEGIETPAQAEALARLGCPRVQGWLFGRPVPPAEIAAGAAAPA